MSNVDISILVSVAIF